MWQPISGIAEKDTELCGQGLARISARVNGLLGGWATYKKLLAPPGGGQCSLGSNLRQIS